MDDTTIRALHSATGELLERTGVRIESRRALDLLARHGVRVDRATGRAHPSLDHVAAALATAPRRFSLWGRSADLPIDVGGDQVYVVAGGASVRVLTAEGRYEDATWEHLSSFTTLLDALPHVHVLLNQVDPPGAATPDAGGPGAGASTYYRRIAAELLVGTAKPLLLQAGGAADVRAFVEMATAIRGSRRAADERPLLMTGGNAEPPLAIPESAAEVLLTAAELGVPCGLGDYLMMGSTGPLTLAGALVQRNAVELTVLLLSQLARPGASFYYVAASGAADLATLDPRTAVPEAVRMLRCSAELGRSYGVPVCGLSVTDARMPDGQAACERIATFLAAMQGGAQLIQGPTSMMDQMMLSSFAQAVIDDDIVGYALAQRGDPDVSLDSLALSAIHEVATGADPEGFGFAAHPHTVAHMREREWRPLVFDVSTFTAWQHAGAPSLVARANDAARRLLDRPRSGGLDAKTAAEILRIAEAPE
jgi:trimethylamine---corrinoid protein Co-methyltransferase